MTALEDSWQDTDDDQPAAPAIEPETNGEPPGSLLAELREQHRQLGRRRFEVFDLPLYDGKLGVRLRVLDKDAYARLFKAVGDGDDPVKAFKANCDVLIKGCVEIVARRDDNDPWEPLVEGETLRFDDRLAELMQLGHCPTAREVLCALFRRAGEDGEIVDHSTWVIPPLANRYNRWLNGEASEVASETEKSSPSTGR